MSNYYVRTRAHDGAPRANGPNGQRLFRARRFSTGAYTSQATADASGQYVYLAEGAGVFGFAIYNSGALATVPPENLSVETAFETSDIQEE